MPEVCFPNEHAMARLQDGTIFVVARVAGDGVVCQYDIAGRSTSYANYFRVSSTDVGRHWDRPIEMHGLGCVRPRLLVLPVGPVLLSGGRQCTAGTKDVILWVNYNGTADGDWEAHSLSNLHNQLWSQSPRWQFSPLINQSRLSAGSISWETQAYTSLLLAGDTEAVVLYNLYVGGAQGYKGITDSLGFAMRLQLLEGD